MKSVTLEEMFEKLSVSQQDVEIESPLNSTFEFEGFKNSRYGSKSSSGSETSNESQSEGISNSSDDSYEINIGIC